MDAFLFKLCVKEVALTELVCKLIDVRLPSVGFFNYIIQFFK